MIHQILCMWVPRQLELYGYFFGDMLKNTDMYTISFINPINHREQKYLWARYAIANNIILETIITLNLKIKT